MRSFLKYWGSTVCVAVLMGAVPLSAGALSYTVTDLGHLGDNFSRGYGINDSGQVAGFSQNSNSEGRAFLWDDVTGMSDLGTLGGNLSIGRGINDSGQVVGLSKDGSGQHAFLWDDANGMINLGSQSSWSEAWDINNSGQVVGDLFGRAFLWDEVNGMVDLGTISGSLSRAYGINEGGQVTGLSSTNSGNHAYLWDEVNGMSDLDTLGGNYSTGQGINNSGEVVGYSTLSNNDRHAFLWDSVNGMVDLGTLSGGNESFGYDVNEHGQAVGSSRASGGSLRAFLWDDSLGGMVDLNDFIDPNSGWTLIEAYGTNNSGQITGWGTNSEGATHAFLLTVAPSAPVPEPATLSLLGMGLAGLVVRSRRRKVSA